MGVSSNTVRKKQNLLLQPHIHLWHLPHVGEKTGMLWGCFCCQATYFRTDRYCAVVLSMWRAVKTCEPSIHQGHCDTLPHSYCTWHSNQSHSQRKKRVKDQPSTLCFRQKLKRFNLLLFQANSGQTSGWGLLRSGGDGWGCWHWQGEAQQAAHCCCENAERLVIVVAVLQKFIHNLDGDSNSILRCDFPKEIWSIESL